MVFALVIGLLINGAHADNRTIAANEVAPSENKGRILLSWGAGYTHYDAEELNEAMFLLAKRTSDSSAGFNNYSVGTFNGHPYQVFELGYERKNWKISLEFDYWVEEFQQEDVAFYTERNSDPDIAPEDILNCQMLRDPNFTTEPSSITGCLEAKESFAFIPTTINLGYLWQPFSQLRVMPSYGLGVMGGATELTVSTDYIVGREKGDTLQFEIWPGVNLLHKFVLDMEYRPSDYFGMSFRAGYRLNQLEKLEIRNKKGESEIFEIVFGEIEDGQKFYIQSYPNTSSNENELVILKKDQFILNEEYYNSIQGDFNGWFIALKLNGYIPL